MRRRPVHAASAVLNRRRLPALFAGALVVASSLSAILPTEAASCSLVPQLRDITINQGLEAYPKLVQGKEALVRAYLSLPSCAASTQTIELRGGSLTVSGGGLSNTVTPTFPLQSGPTYPLISPFYRTTPPVDSPGDPKFVVPGSYLDPTGTSAFTATFTLSISYKPSTSSTVQTVRFTTHPVTKTAITKNVERETNPLRVLVVPVGNASAGYASQYDAVANEELQLAMQTLSRAFPVPEGTAELNGTTGGIRYTVLPTLLDVGHLMPNGLFCLTGSAFDNPIKPQLATFAQEWESANPGIQIDVAVAVIPEAISSAGTCAQGYGVTNSAYAASGGLAAVRLTRGQSGGLMAMEIAHALGMVPSSRGRAGDPSHSPNTAADAGSNRGYNLRDRAFLADDRTSLFFSGTGFTNTTTLLEQLDQQFLLCALGGSTTTDCSNAGKVGDNLPAGPRFVMTGTVTPDGQSAEVVVAYSANVPPTPPGTSGPYQLVQLNAAGGVLRQDFVPVAFGGTHHGDGPHHEGVVDVAVPFNSDAQRVEFRNGATVLEAFLASDVPELTSLQVTPAGERNYTDSLGDEEWPTVSPDGAWVAWNTNPEDDFSRVMVAPIDDASAAVAVAGGTEFQNQSQSQPAWRPDGAALALVSNGDLWTVDVDTSGETAVFSNLTLISSYDDIDNAGLFAAHPTWSPDGSQIAFDADGAIFVIDAVENATGTEVQLTFTGDASSPSWSQTEGDDRIAYERTPPIFLAAGTLTAFVRPSESAPVAPADHNANHFVVNTTDDIDEACTVTHCSLREAINAANATANVDSLTPDIIEFDIPIENDADGVLPHVIQPATPLPTITETVVIDGTTEPDYVPADNGFDNFPSVEIDGSVVEPTTADGLVFSEPTDGSADGSVVNGLVVVSFGGRGILLDGTSNATVVNSYIGLGPADPAEIDRGNGIGIQINGGSQNVIGSAAAREGNVISGNTTSGVEILGATASGNQLNQNRIGTNRDGTEAVPNGLGVYITGTFSTIGGVATGIGGPVSVGNLISGNFGNGIEVDGPAAVDNLILSNYIGTNVDGTLALSNGRHGIDIDGATNNSVGVPTALGGNVISGNLIAGIHIEDAPAPGEEDPVGNRIVRNLIGTNAAGDQQIGNTSNGVEIIRSPATQVGGASPEARNVISANGESGISVQGSTSTGTQVEGNYIGTNAAGTAGLGNLQFGVAVLAPDTTIGGGGEGAGNLISGNGAGVGFAGPDANGGVVAGNLIGTDATGEAAIPNAQRGLLFDQAASGNLVGGSAPAGAPNVIAFNGQGVSVTASAAGNTFLGNSIHSNSSLGIDLWEPGPSFGVTANDSGDADTGANDLQNFPVITAANSGESGTSVAGTLNSTASRTYRVDFFSSAACDGSTHGEGQTHLGSQSVTTDAAGDASIEFSTATVTTVGHWLTATATDQTTGSTSEFSACRQIRATPVVTADPASWTVNTTSDTTDATGCTVAHCSLREAITRANTQANGSGRDTITFAIPGSGPHTISPTSALPTITEAVVIDATSQPGWTAETPQVVLDGSSAGEGVNGFSTTDRSLDFGAAIRGFVIIDFDGHGVAMGGDYGSLENNFIGVDPTDPETDHGNAGSGVRIPNAGRNTIGGSGAVGNVIADNAGDGVTIADGAFNGIHGNQIYDNGNLGIDLGDDEVTSGVTENDELDEDSGANDFMNFPRILSAEFDGAETVVTGDLDSGDFLADPTIDVYSNTACDATGNGEGELYLGSTTIEGGLDATGHGEWSLTLDGDLTTTILTATASDIQSNTSEFSECFPTADAPSFTVNAADDTDDEACTVSHCTLREAINRANGEPNGEGIDTISFDIPGVATPAAPHVIALDSPLPAISEAVVIDASTEPDFSTTTDAPVVQLDGTGVGGPAIGDPAVYGLVLDGGGSTVRALSITNFRDAGVRILSDFNTLQGNYIGIDPDGVTAAPNGWGPLGGYGVMVIDSDSNAIGQADGIETLETNRNIISGNDGPGVFVSGSLAENNSIENNIIGTNAAGTSAVPNGVSGVVVSLAAGTSVGGTGLGTGNVISGNDGDGVTITGHSDAAATTVQRNLIGTNAAGTDALPNDGPLTTDGRGVLIVGSSGNTVSGNVISGNGAHGVSIEADAGATENNVIVANAIGVVNDDGIVPLGNAGDGIFVEDASGTQIGGDAAGEENLIGGNAGSGIRLQSAASTTIEGNAIGTGVTGVSDLGNGGAGITVGPNVLGAVIGGQNFIGFNGGDGISVDDTSSEVTISANGIDDNDGLGIDLEDDGVTANDGTDGDAGANGRQNYPTLFVPADGSEITGTLRSTPNTQFTVELFVSTACDASDFGEGESFLDFVDVTTNQYGYGYFTYGVEGGIGESEVVTATATDPDGNTSEFSGCATPTGVGNEVWTVDPAQPDTSQSRLIENASQPSWGTDDEIAFVRDQNIYTIQADGTGVAQLTDSGDDSMPSLGPTTAFVRFVEDIDLGGQDDVFLLSERIGIQVTATDDNPEDVRLDLIYTCAGSPNYDVAVALPPDSVTAATASWTANYDPSIACPNGTISAVLTDFWNRTSGGGPMAQITSDPKPPVAAIYVPEVDDNLLQWNALALHGSGKDADDGELSDTSLRWFVNGPEVNYGSCSTRRDHCDIQPPGGAWPLGPLTVMLEVTDSDGAIHTDEVTIQVLKDGDEDGIPATVETTCSLSDTNPRDAFGDTDRDGYLAQNDYALGGSPCVPAASYPATTKFTPDTLYIPSTGDAVTMTVELPLRDLRTVAASSVRLQLISGATVDIRNFAWTVDKSGIGTAKFDRQAVIAALQRLGLTNNTVYYTVTGRSSQGWTFEGTDAAVTQPMNP